MLETFVLSFRLQITYRVNSILYSLKQFPLIGDFMPSSLYANQGLKIFGTLISVIVELVKVFFGKVLYVLLFIVLPMSVMKNGSLSYYHLFFFLSIAGAIVNTNLFEPSKDKYYAIVHLKMDASKYAIANYIYFMVKCFIGFLPICLVMTLINRFALYETLFVPLFIVSVKTLSNAFLIYRFKRTESVYNENKFSWISYSIAALCLGCAYLLPYIAKIIYFRTFFWITIATLILSIFALRSILVFKDYGRIYKSLLKEDNILFAKKNNKDEIIKNKIQKSIEYSNHDTSLKSGYAYINDLFFKRHRKLLMKAIEMQTLVIVGLVFLTSVAMVLFPEVKIVLNHLGLMMLPSFWFIMYLLNRGVSMTQAMFMNCDHSLLTYRFYRLPKVILGMFTQRLKMLAMMNAIPALALGCGLSFLLWMSNNKQDPSHYVILIISLLCMSIFFSIHYLVLYYLLQPYNVATEVKSSFYKFMQWLTYFFCYIFLQVRFDTYPFGLMTIGFCVIYCVIALILVYQKAPKTFKIRN